MSVHISNGGGSEVSTTQGSPRSKPAHQNRRTVVVEQTMVKAPELCLPQKHHEQSSQLRRMSTGGSSKEDVNTLKLPFQDQYSSESNAHSLLSPPDSVRSSCSSLVDTASSISSVIMVSSSEEKILDELKRQIASSALRIRQLELEGQQVPKLKEQIDKLERERGKLSNDVLDKQETIQSMKQRLSMLHQQNSQLARLAQASKAGGSSELLRIRNALVASLAQLKQFGEQVETIPSLKAQLRALSEENTQLSGKLKQYPASLPEGIKPADYQALCDENVTLKSANGKLMSEVKMVKDQLSTVTSSCEGLRKRMELYDNSKSLTIPLHERIKRLEKEKDGLYQEIIDLKFLQRTSVDIDTAHLTKEVAQLQKANSQLRSRVEQMRIDSKQQKEQLALKLFELETLNVTTQKYEVEKRLLEVEQTQLESDCNLQHQSPAILSPEVFDFTEGFDEAMQGAPPETKIQLLKLQQLRVHSSQSRSLMQTLITEKEDLDRKVNELSTKLEESGIAAIELKCLESESKLELARDKIVTLERELQAALESDSAFSLLSSENKSLKAQLAQAEAAQKHFSKLEEARKEVEEHKKEHDNLVRSLKKSQEDKKKGDKRYKESRERLRTLAKELASSVQLLKNYQSRCAHLQQQLDHTTSEVESLRSTSAAMRAKLEVSEVEKASSSSTLDDCLDAQPTPAELETNNSQSQIIHLEAERKQLKAELDKVAKALSEVTDSKIALEKKVDMQSSKLESLSHQNETTLMEKQRVDDLLQEQITETRALKAKLSEAEMQLKISKQQEVQTSEKLRVVRVDFDRAEEELEKMTTDREIHTKDTEECSRKITTLQTICQETESDNQRLSSELVKAHNEITVLKDKLDKTTDNLNQLRSLKEHTESAADEVEALKLQTKDIVAERDKMLVQHSKMKEKIAELEEMVESKDTQLKTSMSEVEQKEILLQLSQQSVKDSEHRVSQLNDQISELQQCSSSLRHSISAQDGKLKTEREHTAQLTQQMKEECNSLQIEIEHLRSENKALNGQLHDGSNQALVNELKAKLHEQADALVKLESKSKKESEDLHGNLQSLKDEVVGYKAMVKSLEKQLDEAETREIEHEHLRHKIKMLEKSLGDSSHDNKALITMLHETVRELPGLSKEANRSLQDDNLRLEEQVSVLSQWNDKQRCEIEGYEMRVEELEQEKQQLLMDIMAKESCTQENMQLKRELKEVEMEVNTLRRQARADVQEELQMKVESQTQILTVFTQHNASLQRQVESLQSQVKDLGGTLERDKPVSPPPMPDMALAIPNTDEMRQRSMSDLGRENSILKQRMLRMESEISKLNCISATVRRRSSTLHAISSVPVIPINEELQINVPPEMLLPCSLLADHLGSNSSIEGQVAKTWLDSVSGEWFACMAQKTLSPASAQCYISTVSRLSRQLLDIVVNLQDDKGNTSLHYAVANGNFPVATQFIRLRCCDCSLKNHAGYNPLMLAAAHKAHIGDQGDILNHLIDRAGVNTTAEIDQRTALMLAASSGSLEIVDILLDKGADCNIRDKDGSTALMFAVQNCHTDVVKALLSCPQCNVLNKDNDGLTALDIAKDSGYQDIAMLINKSIKSKGKR